MHRFAPHTTRYFCYDRVFTPNGATCTPATAASIAEFRDAHAACFKYAFERGIVRISITPHIDDGNGLGGWRQTIVFDPIVKYGGYSYNDVRHWRWYPDAWGRDERDITHVVHEHVVQPQVLVWPLVDALTSTMKNTNEITFYLQGGVCVCVCVTGLHAHQHTSTSQRWGQRSLPTH